MDKIAVLVPCYNESLTVKKVIEDWKKELPDAVIYVYDNRSDDGTADIAKAAGAIVRYENKRGKGNVVRRMFREIDAECYIMTDGDDTYSSAIACKMVDGILNHNVDMIIGDRLSSTYFEKNDRPFHAFGNRIVRFFINHLFKADIKDIMSGCRAFSYQFVKSFPATSEGFETETEMTIHAIDKNMDVRSIEVEYRNRPAGSKSKLHTVSDGIKVLKTIITMYKDYRPFRFFSALALLCLLVAVVFFIPVFREYLSTGMVRRFPTLIVCGFAGLFAGISFFQASYCRPYCVLKDKILKLLYTRYITGKWNW